VSRWVFAALAVLALAACANAGPAPEGGVQVSDAWVRATAFGGADAGAYEHPAAGEFGNSAAYMTIRNTGAAGDYLVGVETDVAAAAELHTVEDNGGMLAMWPVEAIEIPAQGRTELAPGGYHVMLIGLKQALKEGSQFPLTLTFEKAGSVTLEVPVTKAGASGGHHHH